jgi:NAD+ kinase
MSPAFKQVAVFGKPRAENQRVPLLRIASLIEAAGSQVVFEEATRERVGIEGYAAMDASGLAAEVDVAIVLGGDGTMLGVARQLAPSRVPLIGVNHGRLGFMTDLAIEQVDEALPPILAGTYRVDERVMLETEVVRAGEVLCRAIAVNDVVVSRGVTGGMVEYTVRVDGVTMTNQRADGVILATPTGSTAYALSANGPILDPSLAGLVLVPVAPQTLSNRPIVLPDGVLVEIEITDVRDASAHFDMQSYSELAPGDIVRTRRCAHKLRLLHPLSYNFFATLRQKLHWSVMPGEPHARG